MQGLIPCTFLFCNRTSPPLLPQLLARSSKKILLHEMRRILRQYWGKVWEGFIIPKHTGTIGSSHMGYNDTRTIPRNRHSPPYRKMPRAAPAMFLYHILGYDSLRYFYHQIINYNSYSAPLQFFCSCTLSEQAAHA